jgi:hypothetical protein
LLEAIRERIPTPVRFGLHLVSGQHTALAISSEVLGVVSLRAVGALFPSPYSESSPSW